MKRRLPRLAPADYVGRKGIVFTACVKDRQPGLADDEVHVAFRELLTTEAEKRSCVVPAYVLMPDHLHALLIGTEETSAPKAAFDAFRLRSGIWLARNRPDLRWQREYYDHVLRLNESVDTHTRYLLLNPVRAGLASDIAEWPYQGSIGVDREWMIVDAFW